MDWVEISVTAGNEAAEAAATLLSRYGSVAVEEVISTPTSGSSFAPVVTVRCYLLADQAERQRQAIETGLWHLSQLLPVGEPQLRSLTENDWMNAWKEHYPVVHAGERLVVVPSWRQYDPKPGEVTIAVDPGMAFGTGLHPSTQLCLRAVERRARPGQKVLDVGTGTGILAIAAIKLGAASVVAMDVEEAAVAAATENVARNGVADRISVHLASLIAVNNPLGPQPGIIDSGAYDLVLVNIIAEVIASMAPNLLQRTAPGGLIVTAGIIEERESLVHEAFAGKAEVVSRDQDGDWVCLCLRPLPGPSLMSARRFYVPPGTLAAEHVRLAGDLAHRLTHVLRLAPGDHLCLFDGSGIEAEAAIVSVERDQVRVQVLATTAPDVEAHLAITLCQALLPSDRFEWAVEKATELGVARIVPLITARSTARAEARGGAAERKRQHWQAVAQASVEQSGRVRLPEVAAPTRLADLQRQLPLPAVVAWEESRELLRPALAAALAARTGALCLIVGPEGGLTADEVEGLHAAGASVVSLGRRVLRSETAGVVLTALALHEAGETER